MDIENMDMEVFFEIHSGLPRQGPGDNESTRRAYALLPGLPEKPHTLDIGCGPGMQTLELARICGGDVVALDNHQPFLDELNDRAAAQGLSQRIRTVCASMFELPFEPGAFDLIWSEGAVYIMGFEAGLREWGRFARAGGYIVVSELAWISPDPPAEARAYMREAYPAMQTIEGNLEIISSLGYQALGHFVLPPSSWWDGYYSHIEARLPAFREKYREREEALQVVAAEEEEIEIYRKYGDCYGYVFYAMQVG